MNTFGELFRVTTFGESHGVALGAVIDGCPAGVSITREQIQQALDRRKPGQSAVTTARAEGDVIEILSGVYEGKTLGTPIAAMVRNHDARSADYEALKKVNRPGHADAVWQDKFKHRDPRGGGRSSGRETLSRVIGGAVAEALLSRELPSLATVAWVSQVGPLISSSEPLALTRSQVDSNVMRCADPVLAAQMEALVLKAKASGDSYGGAISIRVTGAPAGLGEPVFAKLKSALASAVSGVGTVTGVTWGTAAQEEMITRSGLEFHKRITEGEPSPVYGGIQGGISTGAPISLRVLMKPPATLGEHATSGRHDPCILPRAVPVMEAMVSMVLADFWLQFLARPHRS